MTNPWLHQRMRARAHTHTQNVFCVEKKYYVIQDKQNLNNSRVLVLIE